MTRVEQLKKQLAQRAEQMERAEALLAVLLARLDGDTALITHDELDGVRGGAVTWTGADEGVYVTLERRVEMRRVQ